MGAKLLLVTEDEHMATKLIASLDPRGHKVVPVKTVAQALSMLKDDSTIDMVMSDLIFKVGDSFDLLKNVRADHLLSSKPFVFIVSEPHLLTQSLCKAAAILGANKFIYTDSFDPHRICCEIEALLPEQLSSLGMPPSPPELDAGAGL